MSDPRCGSPHGYLVHIANGTEKCGPCRQAHADTWRSYLVRRYLNRGPLLIDATGTRRRINALAAIGWPAREIGARLGVTAEAVRQYASHEVVQQSTAAKVADVYDEMSMTLGPSSRTRAYAARKGWPPPLAFDDDQIDNPAARPADGVRGTVTGYPRDLDREQRVLELTRCGLSAAEIAMRLRTNKRYVTRVRSRYRNEGEVA